MENSLTIALSVGAAGAPKLTALPEGKFLLSLGGDAVTAVLSLAGARDLLVALSLGLAAAGSLDGTAAPAAPTGQPIATGEAAIAALHGFGKRVAAKINGGGAA